MSRNYDMVSRAVFEESSCETNILSPATAKRPGVQPLSECDSTRTDCVELKRYGNFDNDVARIRSVIFAILVAISDTFKYRDGRPVYEWRDTFMKAGLLVVLSVTTAIFFWVIQ